MKRQNFDGNTNFDRPDLNKCPDCGCYFAGENCPLCGKPCPENMKAGNRAPEKKEKPEKVKYVNFYRWYHTWWFIALISLFSPLVGIILFATSPRKKSVKIIVSIIIVCVCILPYALTYGFFMFNGMMNAFEDPVDFSLTKEEYVASCEEIDTVEYYRNYSDYTDAFLTLTVVVQEQVKDTSIYTSGSEYYTFYICTPTDGTDCKILVRDCTKTAKRNYLAGDVITIYGEAAGNTEIIAEGQISIVYPCVNAAFIERQE